MKRILFILLMLVSSFAFSQTDTNTYVISATGDREYIGKILSDDGREVLIITEKLGKIFVPKSEIVQISKIDVTKEITNGEWDIESPFTTRYIFTTNALPIKRGENYTMVNIFGPEAHFAVTNNLNIGVMTTWIASPFAVVGKWTFKKTETKWNFSAGSIVGTTGYFNNFNNFLGLHWLSSTWGDRKNNVTLSGGWGWFSGSNSTSYYKPGTYLKTDNFTNPIKRPLSNGPVVSLSGIFKVGSKASFIIDNLLFVYSRYYSDVNFIYSTDKVVVSSRSEVIPFFVFMPGIRFQKDYKRAFQFSTAIVNVNGRGFPVPMASWFKKF